MKTILLLGAGLVARPLVRYLLLQKDIRLIVASTPADRARALVADHPQGEVVELDVRNESVLQPLVQTSDLVISLLPYTFHVSIAKLCLKAQKHLVTASYLSQGMLALDDEAKRKNVLLLNEIGLDPGIDHMSAMKIIDDAERRGGHIVSFESCCGGLPAPEANDNPFGYKFSWSPRGVLLAGRNAARYRKNKIIENVAGGELFSHHWLKNVQGMGELEVYPNRDSLLYEPVYGVRDAATFFRGTFRYPGWSDSIKQISDLGFLSENENESFIGMSYSAMMGLLIGKQGECAGRNDAAAFLGIAAESATIARLQWLGLFSDDTIANVRPSPIDILTARMLEKMSYKSGERDMVVLQHDFIVEYEEKQEHICSLLLDYGEPFEDSSMARTVSLPTAIAANLIVHGQIQERGVKIPTDKEVYEPVLSELDELGIKMKETSTLMPRRV